MLCIPIYFTVFGPQRIVSPYVRGTRGKEQLLSCTTQTARQVAVIKDHYVYCMAFSWFIKIK